MTKNRCTAWSGIWQSYRQEPYLHYPTKWIRTIIFACFYSAVFFFFSPANLVFAQNQSVSSATSASAAVAKEVSGVDIPRKADGSIDFDQWFTGKSKDEQKVLVKGLKTRADKESYTEYLDSQEKELDATIIAKRNEWKELDATIIALNTIESLQNKLKTGSTLTPEERRQLESAINTPGVSEMVRKWMQKYIK